MTTDNDTADATLARDIAGPLAVLLAAATVGESRLPARLTPARTHTLAEALGAKVSAEPENGGAWTTITGRGLSGLLEPAAPLDLLTMPELVGACAGLMAGQAMTATLLAQALPAGLTEALKACGARVAAPGGGAHGPLTITGTDAPMAQDLTATQDRAPVSPAVALAALCAGLTAPGETRVMLPPALGDVVADLMAAFGVPITVAPVGTGLHLSLTGQTETTPARLPYDWPAAPAWLPEAGPSAPTAITIAVDGPAAAGKGTLARALAARLGLAYLDTGLLYRATGMAVRRAGGDLDDPMAAERAARALDPRDLEAPDLRGEDAGDAASRVASAPAVRAALLDFQRTFARQPPEGSRGAVLDGRDIGSVVCPNAPVKLFVTASVETRAERRVLELRARGQEVIESRVLQDMKERDARDSSRSAAPLVPADDAIVLDTSGLNRDGALAAAMALVAFRMRANSR